MCIRDSGIQIHEISLFGTSTLELGILSIPVTFLWLVGITNAFNLVDGLDGLAAGLASIAAGTCATIFILRGEVQAALLLVILLGSLLGFLRYNFNPAKIFLGDSGSQIIGYTLAISAIADSQKKATALAIIVPLLVFGIPILDTLLSMVRRFVGELKVVQPFKAPLKQKIFKAKQIFDADQGHIHHRLIELGFSHRHAVLFLYGLALALSGLALLSVLSQYRNAGIILMVVGLATFIGVGKLGYKEMTLLRAETFLRWYERVAFNRLFFIGILDLVFISFAYWMTFVLKYDFIWSLNLKEWYAAVFPLVLLLQFAVFLGFGLYQGVWRATGVGDLIRISLAACTAASLSYAVVQLSTPPSGVMSFFIIDLLLLIVLVVTARGLYKVIDYSNWGERSSLHGVLIYGAGKNGQLVLRQLLQDEDFGLRPLGFLDDAPELQGRTVNRTPVLGTCDDLSAILKSHDIDRVVVASAKLLTKRLLSVAEVCHRSGIPIVQAEVRLILSEMNGKKFLDDYGKKKQVNSELLDKTESG